MNIFFVVGPQGSGKTTFLESLPGNAIRMDDAWVLTLIQIGGFISSVAANEVDSVFIALYDTEFPKRIADLFKGVHSVQILTCSRP